ncbi:GNAT family acetyltransferase [Amnibacterium kyonggiense]|uniref:Ribosomal protein S18 acetylase RimI-like enzyme n=1 Tax=Amnibacterium kyonggiense TaxID=595671 RepID=A0A4R7FQX8_9MICO|nr:GNAT family acetyltransferase [Amnibacterium kyonggiense]TDS80200.1 ribosomal protein S18 acetylase RimI-like enzyme [Amnibacterium kyonggiense]
MTLHVRPFADGDEDAVVSLWEAAGLTRPWNDPHRDIERKKRVQRELFLVATDSTPAAGGDDAVVATAMAGYDGHRGWVYYLAVAPDRQGEGLGRLLMAAAEERLVALGCPKVNVQIRSGNDRVTAFYDRLGYAPDGATGLGKRLIPDD